MKYLIVSCTTHDMASRAMVQGAVNGISTLDKHAHFAVLEQPQHHREGFLDWYEEPKRVDHAFRWADCILDIAGIHTNQGNKYMWMMKRIHYRKPYIFMSQSYSGVDKTLFSGKNVWAVARGKRDSKILSDRGIQCHIAPDLSFLVEPSTGMPTYRRVFTSHIIGNIEKLCDPKIDAQLMENEPQNGTVYQPLISKMPVFFGTPEQLSGIVSNAREVHTARYQIACYAILAGKKPIIYKTNDQNYNNKYDDLMDDYYGKSPQELRSAAMVSCNLAWEAVNEK